MKEEIRPFVMVFDGKFADYAAVLMVNIVRQSSDLENVRIFTLVPRSFIDSPEHHRMSRALLQIPRLRWELVTSASFEELVTDPRLHKEGPYPATVYLKLFISSALPDDVNEIIYIDVDTMPCRNLSAILNYRTSSVFAACVEQNTWLPKVLFGSSDAPYFNAGIFITQLDFWRNTGAESHMIAKVKEIGRTDFLDQDILNWYFLQTLSPLPTSFNVFSRNFRVPYTQAFIADPLIIHFSGPGEKPWERDALNLPETAIWRKTYESLFGHPVQLIAMESS